MLVTLFHIAAKRWLDPEIRRPPAEHMKSFALYRHFREQAGRGVPLHDIRPMDDTAPAAAQALLRGTGIHFAMLMGRRAYLIAHPGQATPDDTASDLALNPLRHARIDNPYLPPRPSFYS